MPVPLEPGDRKLLIVAGLLLGLMTAGTLLFAPGAASPSWGYPSSYSAAAGGAKAAWLLLAELGYKVERWESSPGDLPAPAANTLLILADPALPASVEEKQRIRAFISSGGRVLATGKNGALMLPEADVRETPGRASGPEKFFAQLPGPITRQAPEIALQPAPRWGTKRASHLPCYGDAEGATVVSYRLGAGQVVWWADWGPLTNAGLPRASHLMLFLNSVGPPDQTRVLWDEYFHGQRPGLAAYLGRTPAPWLLLQFCILAAAVLVTYSRRSGPVRALAPSGSRLSPLEFIETLGDLYQRKGAAPEALEVVYHRFRFLLLRRLGLPLTASLDQLRGGARDRLAWHDPEFFKMLQRCELAVKAPGLSEAEALRLIGQLHQYTQRWRLAGKFRGD